MGLLRLSLLVHLSWFLLRGCAELLGFQSVTSDSKAAKMLVPFIGCEADGQVGSIDAPQKPKQRMELDARVAQRVAMYQAAIGPSVIGPRGWSCLAIYGSGGATLYLTPEKMRDVFSSNWMGIAGPGIAASTIEGGTSGRFTVARVAARVFPKERSSILGIIRDYGLQAKDYPFGPLPSDRLRYLDDRTVEYETQPRSEGFGTLVSRLQPTNDAIRGVSILKPTFDLRHLAVRIPEPLNDLTPVIIRQFELAE
jgi:hypothetical protein